MTSRRTSVGRESHDEQCDERLGREHFVNVSEGGGRRVVVAVKKELERVAKYPCSSLYFF